MKVIIAGSRGIGTAPSDWDYGRADRKIEADYAFLKNVIQQSGFTITLVVSGTARGVDTLGERYAKDYGIPVKKFPADWAKHKTAAGPIRNREMANYADALIALWDGESRGTSHMISEMQGKGKPVFMTVKEKKDAK